MSLQQPSTGIYPPTAGYQVQARRGRKKKVKKLKKRKKTRDQFARERKAEEVFKYGERRSGLSGRAIYKGPRTAPQPPQQRYRPDQLMEFHQSALINQARDLAEAQRGLRSFADTTIERDRREREKAIAEEAQKERVSGMDTLALALADRVKSGEPLLGYAQHRLPEDHNRQTSRGRAIEYEREATRESDQQTRDNIYRGLLRGAQQTVTQQPLELGYRANRDPDDLNSTNRRPRVNRQPTDLNRQEGGYSPILQDPLSEEEPSPESVRDLPIVKERRTAFLEEGGDPTEFLTPEPELPSVRSMVPVEPPATEVPPIPQPLREADIAGLDLILKDDPKEVSGVGPRAPRPRPQTPFPQPAPEPEPEPPEPEPEPARIYSPPAPEPAPDPAPDPVRIDARTQYYDQMLNQAKGNNKKNIPPDQTEDVPALEILEDLPENWFGGRRGGKTPFKRGVYPAKALGSKDATKGSNTYKFNFWQGVDSDEQFQLNLHNNPDLFRKLIAEGKIKFKDIDYD